MSNALAIATVTATLALKVLTPAASAAGFGANVTTDRPDSSSGNTGQPKVNLYLFQITPNAAWRNRDLPTRTSESQLIQRPRAAIDLHYLLSFYGNDSELQPQRLLGQVVRAMHSQPVLTREMIRDTVGGTSYLAGSNLDEEVELVKFTPLLFSLEELSKLWSILFQTPYALSIAYQASVVLIESEDTVGPALPVLKPMIYALPLRHPRIERVYSSEGAAQPITVDSDLIIEGTQLKSDLTQIRIAGGDPVSPSEVTDSKLQLSLASLPVGSLRAGVQGVQVVEPLKLGSPAVPHTGFESNVAPFVLHPRIQTVSAPDATQILLTTDLEVGKDQRLVLLLSENDPTSAKSYSFPIASRPADSSSFMIPIHDVKPAEYFVRVQVDGAESPVDLNPASPDFGKRVTVP
jgi:hypothetical protein